MNFKRFDKFSRLYMTVSDLVAFFKLFELLPSVGYKLTSWTGSLVSTRLFQYSAILTLN